MGQNPGTQLVPQNWENNLVNDGEWIFISQSYGNFIGFDSFLIHWILNPEAVG